MQEAPSLAGDGSQTGAVSRVKAALNPRNLCKMDPTWHPWFLPSFRSFLIVRQHGLEFCVVSCCAGVLLAFCGHIALSQQCLFAGMQMFIGVIWCGFQCTLVGIHVESTTAQCQLSMAADAIVLEETRSVPCHDQMN